MPDNNNIYNHYRIPTPAGFEEVFSHFYFAENNSEQTIRKTLIPSFQTILVFSFGSPVSFISKQNTEVSVDKYLIVGLIKQAFDYVLPPGSGILVANFKEDAFSRFFGSDSIHPDELMKEKSLTDLWYELKDIEEPNAKVEHILRFCEPYLQERNPLIEQISNFSRYGVSPIKEIAEKNKLSERTVQINHKKQLGYSAKEINRYQRFLKAIRLIQDNASNDASKMDWFEIISECGYYDQSQLIHDFKHYMNLSPTKYLKFLQDICNPTN